MSETKMQPIHFPLELLDKLKKESEETGVSISKLIVSKVEMGLSPENSKETAEKAPVLQETQEQTYHFEQSPNACSTV